MPASLLQTLPSARLLAAGLLLAASLLHFTGWLPPLGWATALPMALPVLMLAGVLAAKRGQPGLLAPIRAGIALVVVGSLVVWQVHEALEKRLAAALEGLDLEVTGVVDAMPQRFDFGDRVRFTLSGCRVVGLGREGGVEGEAPVAGACGRLERLQLDWGSPRAKDRKQPAVRSADNAAGEPGSETADEAWGGGEDRADNASGDHSADEPAGAGRDRRREAAFHTSLNAWRDDIWPEPGQYWRLTVRLKRPVATANPGGFDLELRYLQQGVGAIGRVQARQRLELPPPGLAWRAGPRILTAFESLRSRLRDRLEAVFAHRVEQPSAAGTSRWALLGIVSGLAIGDQAAISASLWGLFSRTGVSHLMAISGMHVTMLALIAAWLAARTLKFVAARRVPGLSRLLGSRPRQVLVLIVAVLAAFGYALLSGWGIPAQRTCWMLSAAATMSISGRGRGFLDVTLLAAGVVVLVDPWAPSTAGFWLSFGAVAAILWCAHGQDRQGDLHMPFGRTGGVRIPTSVRDAVAGQWAATIGLAPLVVALFSILSVIGPLANAVAIPWVSFVVTPMAVAAALLAPFSEPLCAVLLQVNLWMIEHLVAMLKLLDNWAAASVAISRPGLWVFLAAAVGATVLMAPPGMPMRGAGLLCLLPMLLAP
ncbi:MAG TPA: ComEC/Rec2 family competence protein, partial [Lautropia sp.]|nr:ComEC/Rec2 family competence protein [Lautropia sp.]